jgi:two-component system sensor histidine kinase QseC
LKSLRRHLTRTLLGAIATLGGAGLLALILAARDKVIDQFDDALRTKAFVISTLTKPGPDGVRVEFTDRFLQGFDDRRPRDFFEIWDPAGRQLARSESLGKIDLELRPGLGTKPRFWNFKLAGGQAARATGFTFVPKAPAGATAGQPLTLIVASRSSGLGEDLSQLLALAVATGATLFIATLWLIPRVLKKGLEPLARLGEQAAAINSNSLATRFPVNALPEELRPIAVRLNDLLARIEHSFERERRFSSDVAHELRTPLAELRTAAECALKWPDARDSATDRETLAIAEQMEGLVAHMLALARSEQGQLDARRETISLGTAVSLRWGRFAERAASRGLEVELDLAEVAVEADPALLRSSLDNMLENAVEYACAPGLISITVPVDGGELVRIANSVDDLAPADLPRLFERFWRKEAARSGGRHFGLGLPLARAFAEAMGWRLEAVMRTSDVFEIALLHPTNASPARPS